MHQSPSARVCRQCNPIHTSGRHIILKAGRCSESGRLESLDAEGSETGQGSRCVQLRTASLAIRQFDMSLAPADARPLLAMLFQPSIDGTNVSWTRNIHEGSWRGLVSGLVSFWPYAVESTMTNSDSSSTLLTRWTMLEPRFPYEEQRFNRQMQRSFPTRKAAGRHEDLEGCPALSTTLLVRFGFVSTPPSPHKQPSPRCSCGRRNDPGGDGIRYLIQGARTMRS
jgi:hypothetical protein